MGIPYLKGAYHPSIPVLNVRLLRLDGSARTEVMIAIVDTGADMTLVPRASVRGLGVRAKQKTRLVTQWGEAHPVELYLIDMQIEEVVLPGVYVAADENTSEIVLGRNILNKLPLFIDGPQQQTDLLDDVTVNRLRTRRARQGG